MNRLVISRQVYEIEQVIATGFEGSVEGLSLFRILPVYSTPPSLDSEGVIKEYKGELFGSTLSGRGSLMFLIANRPSEFEYPMRTMTGWVRVFLPNVILNEERVTVGNGEEGFVLRMKKLTSTAGEPPNAWNVL